MGARQLGSYDHLLIQAPNRLQAVTNPLYTGNCTIRIEVQPGDDDEDNADRDEITATHTLWRNGEDVWYSLAFMLPAGRPTTPPPGGWMLIDQFFAQDIPAGISGGSPPFAIEITPTGEIDVDVRGGNKPTPYTPAPRDDEYPLAPATPGVWHTLLIHINWSTTNEGLVQVWHRQANDPYPTTPQITARGPNLLTVANDTLPVYAETGIYRSHTTTTQVIYYGGLTASPTSTAALHALDNRAGPP